MMLDWCTGSTPSGPREAAGPKPGGLPAPGANAWKFSESFPVDTRILAGGTLALAGFLTYAYSRRVGPLLHTTSFNLFKQSWE